MFFSLSYLIFSGTLLTLHFPLTFHFPLSLLPCISLSLCRFLSLAEDGMGGCGPRASLQWPHHLTCHRLSVMSLTLRAIRATPLPTEVTKWMHLAPRRGSRRGSHWSRCWWRTAAACLRRAWPPWFPWACLASSNRWGTKALPLMSASSFCSSWCTCLGLRQAGPRRASRSEMTIFVQWRYFWFFNV